MAKISVVIPCYNAGNYIQGTLSALEKQTYQDFNVILVDDCSKDHTAAAIEEYKQKSGLEIIYMKNEKNSGPAVSRNRAITVSDAAYVCFCDSDDYYDDCYLEKMMDAAEKNEADIVICGHRKVYTDGKSAVERAVASEEKIVCEEELLILNVDSLCCMMVNRNIAEKFLLPDLRNGEDMAVIPVWLMHAENVTVIPDVLYNYVLHKGSLSNKTNIKVVDSLVSSFAYIYDNMDVRYKKQIEYIGIRNVIYGALLKLFKCGYDCHRAVQILQDFEEKFPDWRESPYMGNLPTSKRVFVQFAGKKSFFFTFLMARVHAIMIK